MKYMMLLIIVTNLHFGTQREASGVCIQKSVENLEHCSFAGSVVSDQCYALASFDLERNIGKKFLLQLQEICDTYENLVRNYGYLLNG